MPVIPSALAVAASVFLAVATQPEAFGESLGGRATGHRASVRRHNVARQDDISIAQGSHNTTDQFLDHTGCHAMNGGTCLRKTLS
jgi:hypothetical protein